VYHTLKSVFLEVLVLPGEHNFFLASEELPEADPTALAARLGARNVETRWVTPAYIEYVFTTDRFAGVRRDLEATAGVKLNTDLTPICYYYDLALWLSRFYPNLRSLLSKGGSTGQGAGLVSLGWIAVPLVLLAALVRWQRGWAVPVAIGGIGMAQMALEVVILFGFQVLHGYVYAEISFIVTAFMAGLALGGAVSNRLVARWAHPAQRRAQRVLMGVQMGIVAYSAAFAVMLELSILPPRLVFTLLALLAGILGGMAFPLAVVLIRTSDRTGRGVGMLYGADLVGGCLGALLGAVLLVPVLGIPQTCLVIGLVALVGVLMLV
jgi:spermidine synthase